MNCEQSTILDLESVDMRQARLRVREAYRSIRSEKNRTFYCDFLRPYFLYHQSGRVKTGVFVGISIINKLDLELLDVFGDRLDLKGTIILIIGKDVSPRLAVETIRSISVAGLIFGPQTVLAALKNRIYSGITIKVNDF